MSNFEEKKNKFTNQKKEEPIYIMTVELEKLDSYQGSYPHIELSIKQILNEPYYLPRGIIFMLK